ncbi:Wzz/FepE/Etk N-terminal domain-containing protein [Thermoactinospora rubra]|uniref:Wzz/FepE/Etk N-terminal domain-containing protein n=1 Tax=Thermoactinospora rubra TaxID=1088767 RepID=UPI000A0FACF2|nr:Wzz/FepE/Etk N-terminal domain-containing protein [Thermoactinospora rubra]
MMSSKAVALLRWWPQAAAVLAGLAAGLGFSLLREPVYTSEAYVVVVAKDRGDVEQATRFAQAFAKIVTQPAVLGSVMLLNVPRQSVDDLQRVVRVSASPDAPVISLNASATTSERAAHQANAVAQALIAYANSHSADTGVRMASLSAAHPPTRPSSPNLAVNLAVGGAAGALLGSLAYLVRPAPGSRLRRTGTGPQEVALPQVVGKPGKERVKERVPGKEKEKVEA